jgi:hypothetical protein
MRAMLVTALILLPIMAQPAFACGAKVQAMAQAAATDLSAQTKKPVKKAKKIKAKVEYMRAVPAK